MTNQLIRVGSTRTIPAVPYQPARPAYSWTETIYGNTLTANPNGWVVVPPSDRDLSLGGSAQDLAYQSGDIIHTGPGPAFFNNTTVRTVVHNVPATPEVPGSPAIRTDTPPVGWTSFAHSRASILGTGVAKWKAVTSGYAIAMGLAHDVNPTVGYGHITHGLLFTGGKCYNLRTGALYGTYTGADEFSMTVLNNQVVFTQAGSVIGSEASTYAKTSLVLSAAMFGVGDYVYDPSLVAIYGGRSETTLPALTVTAGKAQSKAVTTLPALTVEAGMLARSDTVLPAMRTLASDRAIFGQALTVLPALQGASYGGTLTVVVNNSSDTSLPFLTGYATMLTGGTGTVDPTESTDLWRYLPTPTTIAANRPYATSQAVLPTMFSLSYTIPQSEAYLFETLGAPITIDAANELLVIMMDGVQVATTMVSAVLLDTVMNDLVAVETSMYTSQLLDAIMMAIVNAGVSLVPPGASDETWVVNAATKGSTTYSGFPFNSYAMIGGKHYGACDDGIMELAGDTDNGLPIRASVNLGKLDLGTPNKKTVEQCYIGMSAKGNLFVKVTAEGRDFIYKTRSFSQEMQQQRVTFGKGLRTNYVQLELYNENGADFEIDTVLFYVADMTRRI